MGDYQYTTGTCSSFTTAGHYDIDWGRDNYRLYPTFGPTHDYERFYPQNLADQRDDAKGITAFVVGTGGIGFYTFTDTAARSDNTYGVLKLTLGNGTYSWQFIPTSGGTFTDSGSGTCHSITQPAKSLTRS